MATRALHSLADALPEAIFVISQDLEVLAVNDAARPLCNGGAVLNRSFAHLVENSDEELHAMLRTWLRSRRPVPAPVKWRKGRGGAIAWSCQGFLLRRSSPHRPGLAILRCTPGSRPATRFLALNNDLKAQQQMLRKLQEGRDRLAVEHERATVTLESIGDAVITTDRNGVVDYINPVAEALTGWSRKAAVNRTVKDIFNIVNEVSREPAIDPVSRCLNEGRIVGLMDHTALISRDGTEYVIEDTAAPIRNHLNAIIGAVLVFRDVTEERLAQRQLQYLAQHDTLTTLHNRYFFEQELERAVNVAARGHISYAMLYLDLDQFKAVNDIAGHGVGDELLREVARLFSRRVRKSDVLARLGGDEFGILLSDADLAEAQNTAEKFLRELEGLTFVGFGVRYSIRTSIGIALLDVTTTSPAEALRQADVACYIAKRGGGNRYHVYSGEHDLDVRTMGELKLFNDIKQALSMGRFALRFQAIRPTGDAGGRHHFEVLARMVGDDGDLVGPSAFIPTAERFNIMAEIDGWVIANALQQLSVLQGQGHDVAFSINLSGTSLTEAGLQSLIKDCLRKYSPADGSVIFEVTETAAVAVANLDKTNQFMKELRAIGCRFALDDFGTGFSSFAYLKYLPVDYVKIDGTFVRDILVDPVDQAMVRSINQISQSLGKQTIAEFVESAAILEQIHAIGIDFAQGYHIGRPLAVPALD